MQLEKIGTKAYSQKEVKIDLIYQEMAEGVEQLKIFITKNKIYFEKIDWH